MTLLLQNIRTAPDPAEEKPDYPGITRPMTYEEYLDGPEEMARYDILDGWKVYRTYGNQEMSNPSKTHQRILRHIARVMEDFEAETDQGRVLIAPSDVLITNRPLRSRQPDLLFISQERMAENLSMEDATPLSPAPELVVEIVSPSERPSMLAAKIADYHAVYVREIWLVRADSQTVELVSVSPNEILPVATFGVGEVVESLVFGGLSIAVDAIFLK